MLTKAFAYLRVSSHTQLKGDGLTRQQAAVKKYAAEHGIKIVQTFKEEGVSGTIENMNRPAWAALMTALYGNGVRTILIENLSRLARDLMVQEAVIKDLRKNGFTLLSTAEPDLMANDPGRKFIRQVLGAAAELEKDMLVLKLRAARDRKKAASGKCEGAILYGLLPGEAQIRDRIISAHKAGSSLRTICDALNAEGVEPRRAKRWHPTQIVRITTATPKEAKTMRK